MLPDKTMMYKEFNKTRIIDADKAVRIFQDLLALEDEIDREKEHFYVMHLDNKCRVKGVEIVSIGTMTSALVHPRETYRRAVIIGSQSIIVAHNHPSGDTEPSDEDTKVTKVLFEAGQILGIHLNDHLIFSDEGYFSFKSNNKTSTALERG